MPTPLPHQLTGAEFLASRKYALLADAPRVGKTGTSILAADRIGAHCVLVVTKSSARAQWGREFKDWQSKPREIQVIYKTSDKIDLWADVIVVGWGMVFEPAILTQLQQLRYSLIILDESHEAKNPETKRTKAVYEALVPRAEYVWCLTGTPIPNAPDDLWPMLHYLEPQRIGRMSYAKFREKFCVINRRYINGYWREIVKGGKNEEELKPLLDGFWLRRTQQDVGIGKPLFSIQAVHSDTLPDIEGVDAQTILDAIETGEQITDLHMAEIRRVTGEIKAKAVVELVAEELDEGLDRIVLMCWHKSVIEILKTGLSKYGVVGIDGSTLATKRAEMVDKFKRGDARVFIGQMLAAGEAIDLSAASELMFVETSFVPKDMAQAAMRCSNHSQTRQVHVRVCALEGSIDEAISAILMRKVQTIRQLMEK